MQHVGSLRFTTRGSPCSLPSNTESSPLDHQEVPFSRYEKLWSQKAETIFKISQAFGKHLYNISAFCLGPIRVSSQICHIVSHYHTICFFTIFKNCNKNAIIVFCIDVMHVHTHTCICTYVHAQMRHWRERGEI